MPTRTNHTDTLVDDNTADYVHGFAEDSDEFETSATTSDPIGSAGLAAEASDHDDTTAAESAGSQPTRRSRWRPRWPRLVGFVILPIFALVLGGGVAYLQWQHLTLTQSSAAAIQTVPVATDATIAMLSYHADTAEQELNAARDRLTGSFRDEYTSLITDVVIPAAKQKKITVSTTIPGAASLSATADHADVLVYVNQTTLMGSEPPSDTASSVIVTLEKQGDRWLVSKFEPV